MQPTTAEPGGAHHERTDPHATLIADHALVAMYRSMQLVRLLDQRMLNLQRQGRIGFYGTATGQEAAVIGSAAALEERDWIFPALREGGAALHRGYPLDRLVCQLIGNSGEISLGRQMPCHYSFRAGGFVSMSSVIGSQLPQATGAAMAAKIKKQDVVVMGYLGDGATSATDFHTALNFASVFRSPVVFFCQNNQWAISVPFAKQTASAGVAVKAEAYGMPGVQVDGNDLAAVYRVTKEAVDRARSGGGPTLIEAITFRMGGHSSSDDPTRYRDESQVQTWRERDPVVRARTLLEERGLWDEAKEQAHHDEVMAQISEAITQAERMAPPAPESVVQDVFAELSPSLASQLAQVKSFTQRRKH